MQLPVCQVIFILSNAVILRYRELWCFSSASILSITPPTQWNTAMGLEHPIIRENEFVCSTASRTTVGGVWGGGGPRLTTASVSSGPPPSNQQWTTSQLTPRHIYTTKQYTFYRIRPRMSNTWILIDYMNIQILFHFTNNTNLWLFDQTTSHKVS